MTINKIIILEENAGVRSYLENFLRRGRFYVASTPSVPAALKCLNMDTFDMFFMDLNLRTSNGMDLLEVIQTKPQRPFIVVTTHVGSIESAVDCIKNGASNYLVKPFSEEQIENVLRKAKDIEQPSQAKRLLSRKNNGQEQQLLGPDIDDVRQLIHKVACTDATVLIQGESGTGKEVVAQEIYRHSQRANAPFVRVNCAAIPENLIESEFFGHEKGAFTGALNMREGRFEQAHGGTILLDEISEISLGTQAKLLRVLQEREFERVGGNRTIKVDVRVIATTNHNLQQSVDRKEFRQDLFFRLNVVPIYVPPLRERREDVMVLEQEFMRRFSLRHNIKVKGFTDQARKLLLNHSWPGNVRELQNVIERAIILGGKNGMLGPEHLGLMSSNPMEVDSMSSAGGGRASENPGQRAGFPSLAEIEKKHIFAALAKCEGNGTRAARLLGISMPSLRNRLHEYNGDMPEMHKDDQGSASDAHAIEGIPASLITRFALP